MFKDVCNLIEKDLLANGIHWVDKVIYSVHHSAYLLIVPDVALKEQCDIIEELGYTCVWLTNYGNITVLPNDNKFKQLERDYARGI